jgi:hypothetical protein
MHINQYSETCFKRNIGSNGKTFTVQRTCKTDDPNLKCLSKKEPSCNRNNFGTFPFRYRQVALCMVWCKCGKLFGFFKSRLFGCMMRWQQHIAVFARVLNFLVRPNGTICTGFRLPLHLCWRNLLRFTKHQLRGQHVILYLGLSIIFSLQNLVFEFMFKVLERNFFFL